MEVHDRSGGDLIHLGAGIYAPERVHLVEQQFLPNDSGLDLTADLVLEEGRYVVDRLTASRGEDGSPVTGLALRKIAVQDIVAAAVAGYVGGLDANGRPDPLRFTDEVRETIRRQGPTDDTLGWVAKIYVIGRALGIGAARNVSGVLEIPLPTANSWIRRAKDRGFIDG